MAKSGEIVVKLRETAEVVEAIPAVVLKELLREAEEQIETLHRQLQDGETFLNFSSRSPREDRP